MASFITPWRSVAAAFALNGLFLGCWASRIPAFVDRLELTEVTLGILILVMGLGALSSFALAGKLSDQLGALRVTRWLAALYLVTTIVLGFSSSIVMLGVALYFWGFTHGGFDVAMNTWASEVERQMGRSVMASFHAMWSLGAGLGAAGGYVAISLGASTGLHFLVVAIAAAFLVTPFLRIDWAAAPAAPASKGPLFVIPRGALLLVALMALGAGFGEGAAVDWSAVFLRDVLDATSTQATLGYAIFSVTMVVMRLTVGEVITRFGPVPVARLCGILAASGYLLCATTTMLPMALFGFFLMGMGYAAVVPMAFTRAGNDPDVPAGQAIASVATLGYGAMLLGPPTIGFIAHATSLRTSFVIVGLCALTITVFAASLRTPRLRAGAAAE